MSNYLVIWLIVFVGLPLSSYIATEQRPSRNDDDQALPEITPAQLLNNLRAMTPAARIGATARVLFGIGGGAALLLREVARVGAFAAAVAAVAAGLLLVGIAWRMGLLIGIPAPRFSPA